MLTELQRETLELWRGQTGWLRAQEVGLVKDAYRIRRRPMLYLNEHGYLESKRRMDTNHGLPHRLYRITERGLKELDTTPVEPMTGGQLAAARAFLGFSYSTLADKSGYSRSTIARREGRRMQAVPLPEAVVFRETLQREGIVFVPNGVLLQPKS